MLNKKILTMQDISCFGQCSLTVALPVLSSLGLETVILPSAILSTHTSGFKNFTCLDLTEHIPLILNHWQEEKIKFNAFYSGYLGNIEQIEQIKFILNSNLVDRNFKAIIDPVMADNGELYSAFDENFVEKMKTLVFEADIILPNLSEACFLTDSFYKESYGADYIDQILLKLRRQGAKTIVLTGIGFDEFSTGVVVMQNNVKFYFKHKKIPVNVHGTGDLFSSAFVGLFLNGCSIFESVKLAAKFVLKCIENTLPDLGNHWWGASFEPELFWLIKETKKFKKS